MELAIVIIQSITLLIVSLTFVVYFLQLRAMWHATRGQIFVSITQILQSQDVRKARDTLIKSLSQKPLQEWNQDEEMIAATVCSTYNTAGVFLTANLIELKLVKGWGASARRCFEICK